MKVKQTGVTLLELMVVLMVMGIVASLAVPAYRDTVNANRVQATASKMFATLMSARSEAVKSSSQVTLCKSSDGTTCTTSGFWDQGWIVFRDVDGNGKFEPKPTQPNEVLLSVSGPLQGQISVRPGNTFLNFLTYRSDGTLSSALSNVENQSFKICKSFDPSFARQIFIDASGRPRVEIPKANGVGSRLATSGGNFSCLTQ